MFCFVANPLDNAVVLAFPDKIFVKLFTLLTAIELSNKDNDEAEPITKLEFIVMSSTVKFEILSSVVVWLIVVKLVTSNKEHQ